MPSRWPEYFFRHTPFLVMHRYSLVYTVQCPLVRSKLPALLRNIRFILLPLTSSGRHQHLKSPRFSPLLWWKSLQLAMRMSAVCFVRIAPACWDRNKNRISLQLSALLEINVQKEESKISPRGLNWGRRRWQKEKVDTKVLIVFKRRHRKAKKL